MPVPEHSLRTVIAKTTSIDDWLNPTVPVLPYDTASTTLPITIIIPKAIGLAAGGGVTKVFASAKVSMIQIIAETVEEPTV